MNKAKIQMADLQGQYQRLKEPIDAAIQEVLDSSRYIKGPALKDFEASLGEFLGVKHVIGCANGTDALQISLMALDLKPGDEVIVPAFTYVATAEVIGLLGLKPVMVDVLPDTFNIDMNGLEDLITARTKAIVPVHLFGQSSDMDAVVEFAKKNKLYIVEDNAQALGSIYQSANGQKKRTGGIGHIGCTSFFPSKNLGCYGDGGAIFTNDDQLAKDIRMIANHGQKEKYIHTVLGVNSRLDTIQAAILNVKLNELDNFAERRRNVATKYNDAFSTIEEITTPFVDSFTDHVYHQYTLLIKNEQRDDLKKYLSDQGVPSMIYYPIPLYEQEAFSSYHDNGALPVTESLCKEVLSLPVHTEMQNEVQDYIIQTVASFYK